MRLAPLALAALTLPTAVSAQALPPTQDPAMLSTMLDRLRENAPAILSLSVTEPIEAEPDLAIVSGGVSTLAPTATEALRQNSEAMTRVIEAVRRAGIAREDIQTQGIGLDPQYDYEGRGNGQPPVFTGYRATNTVQLRVKDIARVGPILDSLVTAGATNLSGPNYTLENAEALEQAARLRTIAKAQTQADAYVRAAGFASARLSSISEGEYSGPQPVQAFAADKLAISGTRLSPPTAPGRVRSEVTVNFTFLLEH